MKFFKLPDLGEGLAEAEIVEWKVSAGDTVSVDQVLLSVETAKALVDVPSPVAGVIARLCGQEGDILHIGAPLVEFEGGEDDGTVVGKVSEGLPAWGVLAEGDRITAIDAAPVRSFDDIAPLVKALGEHGGPGMVEVERDGERLALELTPIQRRNADGSSQRKKACRIHMLRCYGDRAGASRVFAESGRRRAPLRSGRMETTRGH